MSILVTGAAGFIGFHAVKALIARGQEVIGIDNVNDYYDVRLKERRLAQLGDLRGFSFHRLDISDQASMLSLAERHPDIDGIIHLAAQAGVRYSLVNPYAYVTANVMGQVVILELARRLERLCHFVYASSSSVYGGNKKQPFSVDDPVETPVSLYAATKRADELITRTYSHLYRIPATGLRFFTVYGPWGRPDMATYLFTQAIFTGKPIRVFNHGRMRRDFTYIDDIIAGLIAALDRPAAPDVGGAPHAVYNLGNNHAEPLDRLIHLLEASIGRKAILTFEDIQPGDVEATFADIEMSRRDLNFEPATPMETGIPRFVDWYRSYHAV